ncbi:MAG: tRNA pseudouridine(38-40) synthase TruA [Kineosporiaceae bacterium]
MPALHDPTAVPPSLMRVRLDLGYDGGGFSGWAYQPGQRTVEGELSEGLATVLRVPLDAVRLTVAGRTDAGVHATGQVAHVDVPPASWAALPGRSTCAPGESMVRRLGGVLPHDVRVHRAEPAPEGFDARFSALRRRYAYRVSDDPAGVPPLRRHDVLDHRRRLDLDAMNEATAAMTGLKDFAAFCRRREGATTVRTLLEYSWHRDEQGLAVATVVADAFCHSMVRSLVGVLLPVGEGRRPPSWPAQILGSRQRNGAGDVVAPHGLVLEEVVYPDDDGLAQRAREARATRSLT